MLSMLEKTPGRLASLSEGLSAAQLSTPPGEGEWSAREVLAHLRACADVWGKAIAQIVSQDKPWQSQDKLTFKAVNPTTWIKQTDYRELDFETSLQAFTSQRAELLRTLKRLEPADWSRTAMVTGAGKRRERSAYTYAQWLAIHEKPHIRQFERIVNEMRGADPASRLK